jgi:uncharacterized damage-inducible protein DinB
MKASPPIPTSRRDAILPRGARHALPLAIARPAPRTGGIGDSGGGPAKGLATPRSLGEKRRGQARGAHAERRRCRGTEGVRAMITPDYCRTMARYNLWQNRSLLAAAEALGEAERLRDRGGFWGSIAGTLSHLLWGELFWMSRFDGGARPDVAMKDSAARFAADWAAYRALRTATDVRILAYADALGPADLAGELVWYSGLQRREIARPKALCLVHFFNHQTHHRGQVHAMVTAAGGRPEDTDLIFMPDLIA